MQVHIADLDWFELINVNYLHSSAVALPHAIFIFCFASCFQHLQSFPLGLWCRGILFGVELQNRNWSRDQIWGTKMVQGSAVREAVHPRFTQFYLALVQNVTLQMKVNNFNFCANQIRQRARIWFRHGLIATYMGECKKIGPKYFELCIILSNPSIV